MLAGYGADPSGVEADPAGWVERCLADLTRRVRHGGNHKYAWGIDKHARRALPDSLAFPKKTGLPLLDALAAA